MSGFDYFYGLEAGQYSFFRVPKILFQAERFKILSCEAKILYGLLLDRMSLSIKNRWFDGNDRVYIIFTVEEITEQLNCGSQKVVRLLKELDEIGLIEKKRSGFGKPNIIYVKNFMAQQTEEQETKEEQEGKEELAEKAQAVHDCENHNSGEREVTSEEFSQVQEESDELWYQNGENHNSGVVKTTMQECPQSQHNNSENHNSRMMKITIQEFPKSQSNNTEKNNTESSDTQSIHLESIYPYPKMDRDRLRKQIHKKIDYTALCDSQDSVLVDELVEIMLEVLTATKKEIRISEHKSLSAHHAV